jgi:large subunit ribosomal protein L3
MKFVLGKKLNASQIFLEESRRPTAVTLVEVFPNRVTRVKSREGKDGYDAVQLEQKKEFRVAAAELANFKVGDLIGLELFQEGDKIKVSGVSKGKGFQGPVKKWGFRGRLSATHGTKHELRTLGSVGSSEPDHVRKGRKMAGRMGGQRVTVRNLKIVKIDKDNNIMAVKGAIPGRRGTLLEIKTIDAGRH